MTILPKATYTFDATPTKMPTAFFIEQEKIISKFLWEKKKILNSQNYLEREDQSWQKNAP